MVCWSSSCVRSLEAFFFAKLGSSAWNDCEPIGLPKIRNPFLLPHMVGCFSLSTELLLLQFAHLTLGCVAVGLG